MNQPIAWQNIAAPLDVSRLYTPGHYLRRWADYAHDQAGLVFHCQTAAGRAVEFRVSFTAPDIVRVRMGFGPLRERSSEMLAAPPLPAARFECTETMGGLTLTTKRLRLEFPRYPWQMRVYATGAEAPFFRQQTDDRAYGPGYEAPPIGFDEAPDGGLTVRETVALAPDESFYGFGESFMPLNKRGQEIISWAVDAGNVTSRRAYKNIPFFLSTAGYGVFVHASQPIVYRMGSESSISYSFHVAHDELDYFLIYGPEFKHILRRYAGLTGCAPVPPRWSFGFWLSRAGYRSQAEVESVVGEMRARGFPCDVISLDPWWMGAGPWCTYKWDTTNYPAPEAMIRQLRAQGVRTCLWITPYVAPGSAAYAEGAAHGYFVHRSDGSLSPALEAFAGGELAAVDFTNPAAVAWFRSKLQTLLDQGVAVFKTDFGEQAPVDAVYDDGRCGLEMHNLYPLLYNRAVFELTQQQFGRGLVWGRSAYAGSQRYPVQWGGDSYGSLDQMAGQLRGLLSYGLSGVPFCSHDVGGFDYTPQAFDQAERKETWFLEDYPQNPVVYVRWLQFGVFSSHVRAHGKQPREPWAFGPEVEQIAHRYLDLRYRLLPYIYSEAMRASQTGLPLARPLVLDHQADPNTHSLDTQYLFGESFLVAPVFTRDGRRRVYLPEGEWVDYWTKQPCAGGCWLSVTAPLDTLPLWVRAGDIIPLGPVMAHTNEKPLDPLTLEIYQPRASGETVIYDEDRPDIPVRYTLTADTLTVEVGAAPGQVEIIVYGLDVTTASRAGRPLSLAAGPGRATAQFEGRMESLVTFSLAGPER
jgi:alpha-D-xyloside xylohydrolase